MHSSVKSDEVGVTRGTELPKALLRAFDTEDHARSFIGGEIRLGLLDSYRTAEGWRGDETEGGVFGVWDQPNPVYFERSSGNRYFILCTSHPEADRSVLIKRFGPFTVRINNPRELLKRLELVWRGHPLASGQCVIAQVVYNKHELLEPTPGLLPPHEYAYSQKPKVGVHEPKVRYEEEKEFRYVLTCTADVIKLMTLPKLASHLTLRLPDCSDICSLT